MLFDNIVKNKVTEFTCRHGDEVCKVTYEYNIESVEEFAKAVDTFSNFLGFTKGTLKDWYNENED